MKAVVRRDLDVLKESAAGQSCRELLKGSVSATAPWSGVLAEEAATEPSTFPPLSV